MLVKVKVKKMHDAEARKISLVNRAASRIPFRVMKSDKNAEESGMFTNGLFDLSRVFKNDAQPNPSEKPAPEIVAVVVQKSDASDELKTKIEATGFEVGEVVDNEDETISYIRKGETLDGEGDLDIIRQSDDTLLVMKGFRPYTDDLSDFAEMVQAQGFYTGVSSACSILSGAINRALDESSDPSEASTAVGKIIDAYRKYVVGMVSALPTMAFKTEKVVDQTKKETAEAVAKAAEEETIVSTESVKKTGEPAPVVAEGVSAAGAEGAAPVVEGGKTEGLADELMKVLKTELDKFAQSLDSVNNELKAVREENKTLQDAVKTSVEKAEKLEAKLNGTVLGDASGEDQPSGTVVKKSEEFVPLLDTAFMPRSKQYR